MHRRPAHPREPSKLLGLDGVGSVKPDADNTVYSIHYDVTLAAPGRVVIEQLYFPGWIVRVDGRDVKAATLRSGLLRDGRMSVALSAGRHDVRAFYDGPPHWLLRNIILCLIGVGALFSIAALARRSR